MEKKKLSRSSQLDVEKCIENTGGSKFDLVILGSAHARKISRINKNSDHTEHVNPVVTALLDIQTGKITKEELKQVLSETFTN